MCRRHSLCQNSKRLLALCHPELRDVTGGRTTRDTLRRWRDRMRVAGGAKPTLARQWSSLRSAPSLSVATWHALTRRPAADVVGELTQFPERGRYWSVLVLTAEHTGPAGKTAQLGEGADDGYAAVTPEVFGQGSVRSPMVSRDRERTSLLSRQCRFVSANPAGAP